MQKTGISLLAFVTMMVIGGAQPAPPTLPEVYPARVLFSILNVPPPPASFDWQMPDGTNALISYSTNLTNWTKWIQCRSMDGSSLSNVSLTLSAGDSARMFFKVE